MRKDPGRDTPPPPLSLPARENKRGGMKREAEKCLEFDKVKNKFLKYKKYFVLFILFY